MNFEKALEAMKQGKKVKRKSWDSSIKYAHMNNVRKRVDLISGLSRGFNNNFYNFEDGGLLSDDWEIYEEPKREEPEMTAEKAKKILRAVRAESILCNKYFEDCTLDELVAAIDFALEILKKQAENAQKMLDKKCECECKIQPAKWFSGDIQKLAFDNFAAGLKCGLNIAKDSQKENIDNA